MRLFVLGGLVLVGLVVGSGCADAPAGLTFDIRALTTAGDDPFDDGMFDRVRIRVQQGDAPVVNLEAATTTTFDLSTSFESLSAPTRVRLELEGEDTLHGAPPVFAPGASQGVVRFAVGVPSTCERVIGFDRDSATGASYTRIDTFVLGAGGMDTSSVWIFDLLRLATTELDPLPSEGPTASTNLGSSSALIVSADGAAYRYDLAVDPSQDSRTTELDFHDGADHTTALLTRENGGALAVGPGVGFTLVAPDGRVIDGAMTTARTRPGLVEVGGSLLIIGGNTEGALFEVVDVDRGETTPMGDGTLPPSIDAFVLGGLVWLLHEDGTTSTFSGCPNCTLASSGTLQDVSVAGPRHVIVGDILNLVTDAESPPEAIASVVNDSDPRALFAYESGIVFVADSDGAQLCFPSELSAL